MKKIFTFLLGMITILHYSQVGINTTKPVKALDINGTVNLRKELRIGGTTNKLGNAGTSGQFYKVVDDTSVISDSWKTIEIANGTGSLSLFYLNTVSDKVGISSSTSGDTGMYLLNAGTTNATFIPGLVDSFTITKTDNKSKAILSFQTTVQISRSTTSDGSASFACGIFLQKDSGTDQLKAVRNDAVRGATGTYKIFNLNVTLDGLQAGSYKVKTACYYRNISSGTTLGIGKPVNTTNLNQEMAQSTLTTSVLQTY